MNRSTTGLPVHHQLPELAQTYGHRVGNAIQPSHPLSSPSPLTFNLSQDQGGQSGGSQFFTSGGQSIGASALASVLPMNIQDWFPLGLTGLISFYPRDSQESSPTPQVKNINSLVLSFLYGPTLTSILDYWKNHTFDNMDLSWQNNVSALVGRFFTTSTTWEALSWSLWQCNFGAGIKFFLYFSQL